MKTKPNLRRLRVRAKLSLREVARRMRVSPMYISDVERGNREFPPNRLAQFMEIVGQ